MTTVFPNALASVTNTDAKRGVKRGGGGGNEITLRDPHTVTFYRANPHIDVEQINRGIVDMLSKAQRTEDASADLHASIRVELQEYRAQMDRSNAQMADLRESIAALIDGTSKSELSLAKIKEDYVREVGIVVANNSLSSNEKLGAVLDRNASHLADRTAVLLAEQVPKNSGCIKAHIQDMSASILEQINKCTRTDAAIPEFIAAFDQKYAAILQTALTQTEMRLNGSLDQVKSDALKSAVVQAQLNSNLDDFLAKYGNSSTKGKLGEANLASVLTKMYPTADIANTSGAASSGDFRLVRDNDKPVIILETKDYIANVDKAEIQKFIRDAEAQGTHGIFLSQSSGITYKSNFQIEFDGGRVLVYVHHCQYCPEKIRAAIDIVDSLAPKLLLLGYGATAGSEKTVVSRDVMDEINKEYQLFLGKRDAIVSMIKEFAKKMTRQVEDLKFVSLDKLLGEQYASAKQAHFTCDVCGVFHGKSKQALSAHKRVCK